MSNGGPPIPAPDESPENELDLADARIASFERHLILLKRERNSKTKISSLPREILSEIFMQARFDCERRVKAGWFRPLGWTALSHVCFDWRETLLTNPGFWNHLNSNMSLKWLAALLERSANVPLNIVVHEPDYKPFSAARIQAFSAALAQHARLRLVDLTASQKTLKALLPALKATAPSLEVLRLKDSVDCLTVDVNSGPLEFAKHCSLKFAPRLRELYVQDIVIPWTSIPFTEVEQEQAPVNQSPPSDDTSAETGALTVTKGSSQESSKAESIIIMIEPELLKHGAGPKFIETSEELEGTLARLPQTLTKLAITTVLSSIGDLPRHRYAFPRLEVLQLGRECTDVVGILGRLQFPATATVEAHFGGSPIRREFFSHLRTALASCWLSSEAPAATGSDSQSPLSVFQPSFEILSIAGYRRASGMQMRLELRTSSEESEGASGQGALFLTFSAKITDWLDVEAQRADNSDGGPAERLEDFDKLAISALSSLAGISCLVISIPIHHSEIHHILTQARGLKAITVSNSFTLISVLNTVCLSTQWIKDVYPAHLELLVLVKIDFNRMGGRFVNEVQQESYRLLDSGDPVETMLSRLELTLNNVDNLRRLEFHGCTSLSRTQMMSLVRKVDELIWNDIKVVPKTSSARIEKATCRCELRLMNEGELTEVEDFEDAGDVSIEI